MRGGFKLSVLGTILLFVGVFFEPAEARVFNFKKENLASYFRGSAGPSLVSDQAFSGAGGANTQYADEIKYNFSGEIGFLFTLWDNLNVRIGVEAVQTKKLSEAQGKNSSDVKLFDLTSEVFVFHPNLSFEYAFAGDSTWKLFAFGGMGVGNVTLDNAFTFTATGNSELGVSSDYTEKSEANIISGFGGLGFEFLFVDNTTLALELGYRYMPITKLKYKGDLTESLAESGGSAIKGGTVHNIDGTVREFDMSGGYIGLSFRFYIDLI